MRISYNERHLDIGQLKIDMKSIYIGILVIIMLASMIRRIHELPDYPYYEDEARTIQVAKNISKYGKPVFENMELYTRGIFANYLISIPIKIFGPSPYSVRSISLILSLLVMLLVYKIGRELHHEFTGLLAALILGFNYFQNNFALSARFYMPFQAFFLITVFFFQRGWLQENNRYKILTIISFVCTILTHEFSVELAFIFFFYLICTSGSKFLKDKYFWYGIPFISIAFYFVLFYHPISQHKFGTSPSLSIGGMGNKFFFFEELNTLFPGLWIVILGLLFPAGERRKIISFYYFAFVVGMIVLSLLAPAKDPRYVLNLFALYIVLFSYAFTRLIPFLAKIIREKWQENNSTSIILEKKSLLIAVNVLALIAFVRGEYRHIFHFHPIHDNPAHALEYVNQNLADEDVIITTNPDVVSLSLNKKVHWFLRQKDWDKQGRELEEWDAFDFEIDSRRNIKILDNTEEVDRLLEGEKRLWVIVDYKFALYTSREMIKYIHNNFYLMYVDPRNNIKVFSNRK